MGRGHAGCWLNCFKGKQGAPLDCISLSLGTAVERGMASLAATSIFCAILMFSYLCVLWPEKGWGLCPLTWSCLFSSKDISQPVVVLFISYFYVFYFFTQNVSCNRGRDSLSYSQHRDQCLAQKALRKEMNAPMHAYLNWGPLYTVLGDHQFSFLRIFPN